MGRVYDTRRWRRLRLLQLREYPLCAHCERRGITQAANEADHILSIERGGEPFSLANLQSLCKTCHSRKTAGDDGKCVRHGCDTTGTPMDPAHFWGRKALTPGSRGES